MSEAGGTTRAGVGVLVPARNEALVLERKLRNIARLEWPASSAGQQAHNRRRVVVVDDGSQDETRALALAVLGELRRERPDVEWSLVDGEGRGKARAIQLGISKLDDVEFVVLTDADVVLREGSLIALVEAFRADHDLVLACGAQEFVRDLAQDGSIDTTDGESPLPAGEFYDRITAKVRALESRSGRLFSVHGQLMAWRPASGLLPNSGFSADDLDLMFSARSRGGRVRLVQGARFLEQKPRAGDLRDGQRSRRAEGYFHVLRSWSDYAPLGDDWIGRLQWRFYAFVPAAAPYVFWSLLPLSLVLASLWGGGLGVCAVLAAWLLFFVLPPGREAARLAFVIDAARRAEAPSVPTILDRWEPPRSE